MTDTNDTPPVDPIQPIALHEEMESSFLEYAMSVIMSRALPDVRDGLKPVHRRIIWDMEEQGFRPDRGHVKCARVAGDTMARFHPHGDSAIYAALVRMAQPFSLRHPLIDFHGTADRTIAYRGGTKLGASYLSTSSWLRRWTQRAGCVDAPLVVPMNRAVDRISWPLCARPEAAVVHYRLGGGTHRWPAPIPGHSTGSVGDTVSATELIWQFFLTHPRLGSS